MVPFQLEKLDTGGEGMEEVTLVVVVAVVAVEEAVVVEREEEEAGWWCWGAWCGAASGVVEGFQAKLSMGLGPLATSCNRENKKIHVD